MKPYFFFLLLFAFPAITFSQIRVMVGAQKPITYETVDKGALRVYYETKSVKDVSKPDMQESDYMIEEDRPAFQWQIEPDTREILSYTCQKAVTDFRGRHYEVWFAPDLPLNDGPWKFSGLPGLILAAEDSDKYFTFQAVGIENSDKPVQFPQKDYVKTSRKEVEKVQKRFIEDPMGFIKNSNPGANISIKVRDENGVERTGSEIKFPYNPMELE